MTSVVCADAGLCLKLVLPEHDSALARALWDEWRANQTRVIAPTLWAYEVTSVIRNRVHRGLFPADREAAAFDTLHRLPVDLQRPDTLHQRAAELARHFNRPSAYDAHYLALAQIAGCPLWTADERLFNAVRGEFGWVYWLGNHRLPGTS